MGDFILYHKDRTAEAKVKAALTCLAEQGSKNPFSAAHDGYVINFFPEHLSPIKNVTLEENGDFCGSSGTFIYKNLMGQQACAALLHDFTLEGYQPKDYSGIFTVILRKNNRLYLLTDPLGGNRVYRNDQQNFWASSFLAAATASAKLSVNRQALYEYAFQETTYGQDTIFNEVTSLNALKIFEFTPDGPVTHDKNLNFDFQPSTAALPDLLAETAHLLRGAIRPVSAIFGDKIRTALSGGYDSRLMLALLKDSGSNPGVYVYGPDDSPDVTVARTIARGEGFALNHINKASHPVPTPEEYDQIVRDNFYGLDGLPGEGIFDFGANMATRRERSGGGHMIFNGGGGEIFRNFFYLPDKTFTVTDLINSFYCRYTTDICTEEFNERGYRAALRGKIMTALGVTADRLNRQQVDYAYPAFRLRYWTARDNNNNTRLGPYLTPFISYSMIKQALTIPIALKNHGIFQAALIRAISPELAAYPSDYGYSFDQKIPLKAKIKNILTYHRPTCLRRYSYAIQHKLAQHRMAPLALPKTLTPEFLAPIFKDGLPHMAQYFKIDQIKDTALLSRLHTLEYLFQHFKL